MALYHKKWWKKIFEKKERYHKHDILKSIEAINEFLSDLHHDVDKLKSHLVKLDELERERQVAASGVLHINLETQAKEYDTFLERWEFFQTDVDLQGERVKKMATEFLHHCEKAHLKDLVSAKRDKSQWQFKW